MADPVGCVSLAITLIQGAYKSYQVHKLTEAFGSDFRSLQRRFETQKGLLCIQAYRLRQATILGLAGNSLDENEWLAQIHGLVLEIKLSVETCQNIVQKYIRESTPSMQLNGSKIRQKGQKDQKDMIVVEPSDTKEDEKLTSKSRGRRIRRFFGGPGRNKGNETEDQKDKPIDPVVKEDMSKAKAPVEKLVSQLFKETEVSQKQKAEQSRSISLQEQAKYKTKLRWVTGDKQTYLDNLQLIASDIQYLRSFVDIYIQSPNNAMNGVTAPNQISKQLLGPQKNRTVLENGPTQTYQPFLHPSITPSDDSIEELELLQQSTFECQQAFQQLRLDITSGFLHADQEIEALSIKLCYDHMNTRREFRPNQDVSIRKNSIIFLLQAQLVKTSPETLFLVIDTPVVIPCKRIALDKHLEFRIQKGEILRNIAGNTAEIESRSDENYLCLGSFEFKFSRSFRISEEIVPLGQREKGKQAVRSPLSDAVRPREAYLVGLESDSSETESSEASSVKDKSEASPGASGPSKERNDDDLLTQEYYDQLQKPILNHVYQDRSTRWTTRTSLEELLKDKSFRHQNYAEVHLRLALLLTSNYLNLGTNGHARAFRPVDCIYYRPVDSEVSLTHEELLLSPFLHIPTKLSTRRVGLSSGISSMKWTALLELGLLLYQIGSWQYCSYEHPDGFQGLVRDVATNLTAVANHTGPLLTYLIHYCLTNQPPKRLSMRIPISLLREWPRYGDEETYHILKTSVRKERSKSKPASPNTLRWWVNRPGNEVLEIAHFVLRPLQTALHSAGLLEIPGYAQDSRPTFFKVNKDHLSVDTLLYYDIPYEYDRADPDYLIILQKMNEDELEVLFEHTRRLRTRDRTRGPYVEERSQRSPRYPEVTITPKEKLSAQAKVETEDESSDHIQREIFGTGEGRDRRR